MKLLITYKNGNVVEVPWLRAIRISEYSQKIFMEDAFAVPIAMGKLVLNKKEFNSIKSINITMEEEE